MLKKGFVKKAKQSRMLRNSDKIMSVLTNGKVKLDCITKEWKLQLEEINVEVKLLRWFHLKPLRKLINDK